MSDRKGRILVDAPRWIETRLIIEWRCTGGEALEATQKVDVTVHDEDAPPILNSSPESDLSLSLLLQSLCSSGVAFLWFLQQGLARTYLRCPLALASARLLAQAKISGAGFGLVMLTCKSMWKENGTEHNTR